MLARVSRFLQVGALAFLVDAVVLWFLVYQMGWPPVFSRVISFAATLLISFPLNAAYTFSVSVRDSSKTRYIVIQCVGVGLNFAVYSGLVLAGWLGPLWALVFGSACASAHNYLLMRRFVFHDVTSKHPA